MDIRGKIIKKFDMQSGISKSGSEWVKQEYVLETNEQYPKKIFFDFWGEKAKTYQINEGETIILSFDVESREFNGRWYTTVRGWKAEKIENASTNEELGIRNEGSSKNEGLGIRSEEFSKSEEGDDLPF